MSHITCGIVGQEVKSLTKRLRQTRPDQTRPEETTADQLLSIQGSPYKNLKPTSQECRYCTGAKVRIYCTNLCHARPMIFLFYSHGRLVLESARYTNMSRPPGLAPGNLIFKHACCSTQVMYIWDTVQRISNPSHRQDELSSFLLNLAEHLVLGLLYRQLL